MDVSQRVTAGTVIFGIYLIFLLVGSIAYVSNGNSGILLSTLSWGTIVSFGLVVIAVLVGASYGDRNLANASSTGLL